VPRYGVGVDPATGVGDQLGACGDQFAQVIADRGDQRLRRVLGAFATEPAHLRADEIDPLLVTGDPRGGDDGRPRSAQTVREGFAFRATQMGNDEQHVRIGFAHVVEQRRGQVLLRVLTSPDDKYPATAEQGRTDHLGQFTGDQVGGQVLTYLDVRVNGTLG